ncbi:MAG: cytochrome-c peroxidase [Luteibaculum sp.]
MGKFQIKLLPNLTICLLITGMLLGSCKKKESETVDNRTDGAGPVVGGDGSIPDAFGGDIDLDNLPNYGNQSKPAYILKDNSDTNAIDDAKATIGRVFFYDKRLSIDNSISCGSCHQQAFGFSDTARVSTGVNGTTARHSMRLINARFGAERKFFWDERATSLEDQTTHPIKDQVEMGFSEATFNQLLSKLEKLGYYQELFYHVYGDIEITEERMQECLAMFIRSIQSFDSKYDQGRAGVANDQAPFPNFSEMEEEVVGSEICFLDHLLLMVRDLELQAD